MEIKELPPNEVRFEISLSKEEYDRLCKEYEVYREDERDEEDYVTIWDLIKKLTYPTRGK